MSNTNQSMVETAGAMPDQQLFTIRAYEEERDAQEVDRVEKMCEAGPSGQVTLFTDLLGDPLCRLRHFPAYAMLVAEVDSQAGKAIAGMIRAGVKEVVSTCSEGSPRFAKTAYILGLRVAPYYRRLGIGEALVKRVEEWCKEQGAEYAYMATEKDNEASVNLFTKKLGYAKFRTPCILVQPVYAAYKKLSSPSLISLSVIASSLSKLVMKNKKKKKRAARVIKVEQLSREDAEALYRRVFIGQEFFPRDVDAVMRSRLNKGTWVAREEYNGGGIDGDGSVGPVTSSWAVLSVWKCNEIFKLEVKGLPARIKGLVAAGRLLGRLAGGAALPTPPDVADGPFGLQLLYGLHAEGERGGRLLSRLCWMAHNMAKRDGCAVLAAEIAACDPLRRRIPHWRSLSDGEDLWCIKRLLDQPPPPEPDWSKQPPPASIFVDPRDF